MIPLPIDPHLGEIVASVRRHKVLVLGAPPGTGKTTRVPPALIAAGVPGKVIVLEPRRLAARSAAARVAEERGAQLGGEVGYRVRHDKRSSAATRIEFVTEGVLVRQLLSDPGLDGVGAVVLDEFHERHLEGDLALAMLAEIRATIRDDLALVIMSATLDPAPLLAYLPGAVALAVASPLHPVEVVHGERASGRDLAPAIAEVTRRALRETTGDVLVFLPGVGEIRAAADALAGSGETRETIVLPLHGQLPPEEQDLAVRRSQRRKIVLATNVAESSITIDGVTAVVDSGLARVLRFDTGRGLDVLRLETISKASAEQRKGRAGRTAPGRCYRLWSRADERGMPERDTPEVRRVDLAGPALEVRVFAGRDPREFAWFEAPEATALARADALATALGALDASGRVTALGRTLLEFPLHPRLARILVAAQQGGFFRAAALCTALASERDIVLRERAASDVEFDLVERAALLARLDADGLDAGYCRREGIDIVAARAVLRAFDQVARGAAQDRVTDPGVLRRGLLVGYPDRVGLRDSPESREARLCGGRGALVPELAARGPSRLFLAIAVRETDARPGARALVEVLSWVDDADLRAVFGERVRDVPVVEFDAERGRVVGRTETRYEDLVLASKRTPELDPELARTCAVAQLAADPWRWLGDEKEQREVRDVVARLRWLAAGAPELGVAAPGDPELAEAVADTLRPGQPFAEVRPGAVLDALLARLPGGQRRLLEQHAPASLVLPTGRVARVEYGQRGPSVAVRMQELFGLVATPRLCGGRVPLTIEVLAPNHRPVQITQDLASFWKNVYPQVRSELSRRYPRHSWPEDPVRAAPEARPRRRT